MVDEPSMSSQLSVQTEFGTFEDNVPIFIKRWTISDNSTPRALLIFLHGFAEHVGRYDHVWPRFASQNMQIVGYDQRGFGRSGPRYGDTTLDQQVADLAYVVEQEDLRLKQKFAEAKVPIYLYGHSMVCQTVVRPTWDDTRINVTQQGACVVLSLLTGVTGRGGDLMKIHELLSGVICSAPLIQRTSPPSNLSLWLLPKIAWLFPNLPFKKTIDPSHLTSDAEAAESTRSDPLVRGDVFIKTISGMVLAGYDILDKGYINWPPGLPILITHGQDDPSASPQGSQKFIDMIQADGKKLKIWPGMLHEGHNERQELREPFLEYTLNIQTCWHKFQISLKELALTKQPPKDLVMSSGSPLNASVVLMFNYAPANDPYIHDYGGITDMTRGKRNSCIQGALNKVAVTTDEQLQQVRIIDAKARKLSKTGDDEFNASDKDFLNLHRKRAEFQWSVCRAPIGIRVGKPNFEAYMQLYPTSEFIIAATSVTLFQQPFMIAIDQHGYGKKITSLVFFSLHMQALYQYTFKIPFQLISLHDQVWNFTAAFLSGTTQKINVFYFQHFYLCRRFRKSVAPVILAALYERQRATAFLREQLDRILPSLSLRVACLHDDDISRSLILRLLDIIFRQRCARLNAHKKTTERRTPTVKKLIRSDVSDIVSTYVDTKIHNDDAYTLSCVLKLQARLSVQYSLRMIQIHFRFFDMYLSDPDYQSSGYQPRPKALLSELQALVNTETIELIRTKAKAEARTRVKTLISVYSCGIETFKVPDEVGQAILTYLAAREQTERFPKCIGQIPLSALEHLVALFHSGLYMMQILKLCNITRTTGSNDLKGLRTVISGSSVKGTGRWGGTLRGIIILAGVEFSMRNSTERERRSTNNTLICSTERVRRLVFSENDPGFPTFPIKNDKPFTAEAFEWIFALRARGMTFVKIGKRLFSYSDKKGTGNYDSVSAIFRVWKYRVVNDDTKSSEARAYIAAMNAKEERSRL